MKRFIPPLFGALVLCASACSDAGPDFVDVSATLVNGQALPYREQLARISCDSKEVRCISLAALTLTGETRPALRGLRITYVPESTKVGVAYTPSAISPVRLYVTRAVDDQFIDVEVAGGTVTFNSIASGPGQVTDGSFSDQDVPAVAGDDQSPVKLTGGTFHYLQQ